MSEFISFMAGVLPTFMLVISRTLGLFLQAPVLGNRNLPPPVRMTLIMGLSVLVMTLLPKYPDVPTQLMAFILMALTEFELGALFGFSANLMFLAIQSAGELGGVQSGLSSASVQNPFTKTNVNAMGTLFLNTALLIYLVTGGHLYLIGAYFQSYQLVPIGTFFITPEVGGFLMQMSGGFLAVTLQLALPMVIVVFMAELGVGYMGKVAQQASSLTQDLVTIAKPVSGMLLLLVLLPNLMTATHRYTENTIRDLDKFLRIAGQAQKRVPYKGPAPPAYIPMPEMSPVVAPP